MDKFRVQKEYSVETTVEIEESLIDTSFNELEYFHKRKSLDGHGSLRSAAGTSTSHCQPRNADPALT